MRLLTALTRRFAHRPEPPTAPTAAAPFDDGLVVIARLISADEQTDPPHPRQ